MNISMETLKTLREQTSAGMIDCQKALKEAEGDLEKAKALLRARGIALAEKKADRMAKEGVVCSGVSEDKTKAFAFEVNTETDFVARNEHFQEFIAKVRCMVLKHPCSDKDALLELPYNEEGSVKEQIKFLSGRMGEKIDLCRFESLSVEPGQGTIGHYVHGAIGVDMGRIAVLVVLKSKADPKDLEGVGRDLALHVAAFPFACISDQDMDPEDLKKHCTQTQERCAGNNETFCEKAAIKAYCKENIVMEQSFVRDASLTVQAYLEQKAKELGSEISITKIVRFECGGK